MENFRRSHMIEEMDGVYRRYIAGWLKHGRHRKLKKNWCVLKGRFVGGEHLIQACLFCFKDSNTHVREHFVCCYEIPVMHGCIRLRSIIDKKSNKCGFHISIDGKIVKFVADDDIIRQRWIYAIVDLVGKKLPPSELPDLNNEIRSDSLGKLTPQTRTSSFIGQLRKNKSSSTHHQFKDLLNESYNELYVRNFPQSDLGVKTQKLSTSSSTSNTSAMEESLNAVRWYHGNMSRGEASTTLRRQPCGTYLLRNCSTEHGSYTVSMKVPGDIVHYKIVPVSAAKYMFDDSEENCFDSPDDAVCHFVNLQNPQDFYYKPLYRPRPTKHETIEEVAQHTYTREMSSRKLRPYNFAPPPCKLNEYDRVYAPTYTQIEYDRVYFEMNEDDTEPPVVPSRQKKPSRLAEQT